MMVGAWDADESDEPVEEGVGVSPPQYIAPLPLPPVQTAGGAWGSAVGLSWASDGLVCAAADGAGRALHGATCGSSCGSSSSSEGARHAVERARRRAITSA